jgi:NitT/TauT family transport system ATP-binding protein
MTVLSSAPFRPITERASEAAPEAPPALRFDAVTCHFAAKRGAAPYTAVRDVRLEVEAGEFVSVVGPTGCGKSTLLNVAAGLLRPSEGSIHVFGAPLSGLNRQSAYLFQADALMPWCSAIDNIAAGLLFRGARKPDALAQARLWLGRVGLSAHGERYPHQMSGGMRKRVALAQALVLDPPILLMDEPFSALDVQTRQLMEDELLRLWSAARKSVLFVTHDLEEAISLSDRVIVLAAGPATRPIAEFAIDLPRPREVAEIRLTQRFLELHTAIWQVLKTEVLTGYARSEA